MRFGRFLVWLLIVFTDYNLNYRAIVKSYPNLYFLTKASLAFKISLYSVIIL